MTTVQGLTGLCRVLSLNSHTMKPKKTSEAPVAPKEEKTSEAPVAPNLLKVMERGTRAILTIDANKETDWKTKYLHRNGRAFE